MRNLIIALSLLMANIAHSEIVELTKENSHVLYGEVNHDSVNNAIIALSKPEVKYLVLNSPGGDVGAGNRLISWLPNKPKLICIANFAASMAFSTLQACPTRYVVGNSIIMQHQITLSLGPLPLTQFDEMYRGLLRSYKINYEREAKRLGLTLKNYLSKVQSDFWMFTGEDAVNQKAADKVVTVKCSTEMLTAVGDTETMTIFGPISASFPLCPSLR
jgi:ATP-dependent protease ClpP protease subunit